MQTDCDRLSAAVRLPLSGQGRGHVCPYTREGESQGSVTKDDLRQGALAHLQDVKVGTHRGPQCLARIDVLSSTMKEACRQRRRIKVGRSVVRHHSHGRAGGSVCVEGAADVMKAWSLRCGTKHGSVRCLLALDSCHALRCKHQFASCHLADAMHSDRHSYLSMMAAHGCGSERMFEPIRAQ